MSAVKAWDDSTMHRSRPAILTNRRRHRPRNELLQPFDQLGHASGGHLAQLTEPRPSCA